MNSLRLDELTGRDGYEALVGRFGGDRLAAQLEVQRTARQRLQAALGPEQRALFLNYADATGDAALEREEAVLHTALCFGAASGAALARAPDAAPDAVVRAAVGVVHAVLGSDLPPGVADAVGRAALDALIQVRGAQGPTISGASASQISGVTP